jgi:sterol desaturase/sphingolipid hydroxylase (fatty acid hydroxylase superfamily)
MDQQTWVSALIWDLIATAVAVVLWAISWRVPFRRIDARPEVTWDIAALACTVVFGAAVGALLAWPAERIQEFSQVRSWYHVVRTCPAWLVVLANIIVGDLLSYWAHRLLHTRRLWPTHAWHHSPRFLYWAAGLRGSPVHVLLTFGPLTAGTMLLPLPEDAVSIASAALFSIVNQHLIHSNIRLPLQRQLELVFVTPRCHFAHHSANERIGNSNFGFVFTVWDRMFGTFTDPDTVPRDDPLGLADQTSSVSMIFGWPARVRKTEHPVPVVEAD